MGVPQSGDPIDQSLSFNARLSLSIPGLLDYRSRDYSFDLGRFVERDHLGYSVGASLYEYVRSNPTNNTDPYGFYGHGTMSGPLQGAFGLGVAIFVGPAQAYWANETSTEAQNDAEAPRNWDGRRML